MRESQAFCRVGLVDAAPIGAQVRALRERSGLQSQELAKLIGLDPSALSNVERGKRSLKSDELAKIASVLRVSPLAILDPGSLLARLPVAPRAVAGAIADGSAIARLTALAELDEVLTEEGFPSEAPLSDVPTVDETAWKESADRLAEWACTRIGNVSSEDRFSRLCKAIEHELGVDVLVEEHRDDALAGASITDWRFPLIFVNANQPTTRALFTLAHELAHVLAGDGEALTIDIDLTAHDDRERFANAFAATFLMPEKEVRRHVQEGRTTETLVAMLEEFGVSYEALIYRLHNLRLISAHGRDELQAVGWRGLLTQLDPSRSRELLTRVGTRPEQQPPEWLTTRAFAAYLRGAISVRPLAGLLHVDPDALLDQLAGMDKDAEKVLNRVYTENADQLTDEEAYSGTPA